METTIIKIQGMTCQGCVSSVKTVLERLPNVAHADVSLETGQATVLYDPENIGSDQLKAAIIAAGFDIAD